jgi:cellobiose phosphorylase
MIMAFARLGDNKRVWELLNIINPINHGNSSEATAIYKVEPYVLAADVYAGTQHAGRGGWTWYTGSASWMYRLIIESFLGLQQEGNKLKFAPCVPKEWGLFKVDYRYKNTVYYIVATQKDNVGEMMVTVDGMEQEDKMITLIDDQLKHTIQITI